MRRPLYVFQRLASDIVGLISRFINAIVFHGSTAQTLSARAHVESRSGRWLKRRQIINAIFFWQDDHCAGDWAQQVERALRTLEINEALSSDLQSARDKQQQDQAPRLTMPRLGRT